MISVKLPTPPPVPREPLSQRFRPRRLARVALVLIVVVVFIQLARTRGYHLFALAVGHNPFKLTATSREGERLSRERGEKIIAALRQYQTDHGRYPDQLHELIPRYLADIEPPVVGRREWNYGSKPKKGLCLDFFVGPIYERDWYQLDKGQWEIDR